MFFLFFNFQTFWVLLGLSATQVLSVKKLASDTPGCNSQITPKLVGGQSKRLLGETWTALKSLTTNVNLVGS